MFTPDEPDDAPDLRTFQPFKFSASGTGIVTPPTAPAAPTPTPPAPPSP